MNKKYSIFSVLLSLMLAGVCFQACQQDDLGDAAPDDIKTLVAQGRYLSARSAGSVASSDNGWFEKETPYRLLVFSKKYDKDNAEDETPAKHLRLNQVAWEGETSDGTFHFINIDGRPDVLLGFNALDGEDKSGTDGLVSLDFYGFTYGKPMANRKDDYISLDNPSEELDKLSRTEEVTDGVLNDLMYGSLKNRNIYTVGLYTPESTQSIMPFKHCFSQLKFSVVQQPDEDNLDENGKPLPSFKDITIEKVEVTGTFPKGTVCLQDGSMDLFGDRGDRSLIFRDSYKGEVPVQQAVSMGEMIIFPSHGGSLRNYPDGYTVGLKITVRSSDKKTILNFLTNTGSGGDKDIDEPEPGVWRGTIVKSNILDNETNNELRFKQGSSYSLILSFQKNAVRIFTVIPKVEEWLNGEGTPDDPWQTQALGQPQMFDNVVWSDRNLGADHFDPISDNGAYFERCIGYFYQSGRNIPYYPFNTMLYANDGGPGATIAEVPTPADKNKSVLAVVPGYEESHYRPYPMVDPAILNMMRQKEGWGSATGNTYENGKEKTWTILKGETPQMRIPEEKPGNAYFDFMRLRWSDDNALSGYDEKWDEGPQNQPVNGAWAIPSSDDFLTVFPSTPFAGNIVFRGGGNCENPVSGWSNGVAIKDDVKVLRVTVPYYNSEKSKLTEAEAQEGYDLTKYEQAWDLLAQKSDAGTTPEDAYSSQYNPFTQRKYEPAGDPEPGYASVYIISRDDTKVKNKVSLDEKVIGFDIGKYHKQLRSWGTIYAIKRIYTSQAYRMRWRVLVAGYYGGETEVDTDKEIVKRTIIKPGLYVEICRYRCNPDDKLELDTYMDYDWEHPAARLYFPICGLCDWPGKYINFGTECQYATSDPIDKNGYTGAVHIKITGDESSNAFMAVVKKKINRHFGKQIRPVVVSGGGMVNNNK